MRLLNTKTYEIREFLGDSSQRYAILSHTWGDEECTLQHMTMPGVSERKGYAKIKYCCDQAAREGLDWAWVDTCCIDKTSTAELSEAINSMFRWYRNAVICYAYLADVASVDELGSGRWWGRGWTLQELLAPKDIRFYSADWRDLGSKQDLGDEIEKITGIERSVLLTGNFDTVCIAKRMSWAANRKTTRVEDTAYSLLGIFGVNIPLLYGEGTRSFVRLQEEIMKVSDDHTLFAWGLPLELKHLDDSDMQSLYENPRLPDVISHSKLHGLLASSPSDFVTGHDVRPLQILQPDMPPMVSSSGVRIELPVWTQIKLPVQYAAISCHVHGHNMQYLGIPLLRWGERFTARCGPLALLPNTDWPNRARETLLVRKPIESIPPQPSPKSFKIVRTSKQAEDYFTIEEVYCLHGATYSQDTRTIRFPPSQTGPLAILFFGQKAGFDQVLFKKYQELSKANHREPKPRLRKAKGYSFVSPFAVVLGSGATPWVCFVPILGEDTAHDDFHKLLHERKHLVKHCATKRQLRRYLDDERLNLKAYSHIDACLHRTLTGFYVKEDSYLHDLEAWDISLCVKLLVRPADFVENAIFVCIDISFTNSEDRLITSRAELHQGHFTGNWWDALELKGFSGTVNVSSGRESSSHGETAELNTLGN
ncbi:heterokaryon incompatibility protein-domain-containing protein [Hypoxylon sp. FL1284]|nr:heterokaryon incompatibility protein-domain-containing protein [Hypoxylon sp. FL1284]